MSNLQTHYHFKLDFTKNGPGYMRQVIDPRHQTLLALLVAEPGALLQNSLVENLNMT